MAASAITLTGEDQERILRSLTEMKGLYAQVDTECKRLGKADSETIDKLNKLTDDVVLLQSKVATEAQKRLDTLEGEVTSLRKQLPNVAETKSFGARVTEEAAFIKYLESGAKTGFSMTLKAGKELRRSLMLGGVKNIQGLSAVWPAQQPGVVVGPRLALGVRSLVPQGNTTSGAIQYLQETSFTNNAAPVAEGAAKPKSDKTFLPKTALAEVIAHYFKVSRQSWEDIPGLEAVIENNGIYGVAAAEDNQLLNGSGASPQLLGFNTVASAAPAPPPAGGGPANTIIDAIGLAVFDLAAKGYMPDGAVMNPVDYGAMAMRKNADGNYLFANPIDYAGVPRVWGVRLVMSSKQAAGTGLVGAFQGNSLLLDREEVNVQVAAQNEDDFIKNMLTVLIEERLMLLIYNAGAFEKIVTPAVTAEAGATSEGGEQRRNRRE